MNVIEEIKKLDLPTAEYVIIGGAVMAVHGIRDTDDIDIVVTPSLFQKYTQEGWELNPWTKTGKKGKDWLKKDKVEMYKEVIMSGNSVTLEELSKDIEIIDGVPFISLQKLVEFKTEYWQLYNRPKDVNDLALIEQFLSK